MKGLPYASTYRGATWMLDDCSGLKSRNLLNAGFGITVGRLASAVIGPLTSENWGPGGCWNGCLITGGMGSTIGGVGVLVLSDMWESMELSRVLGNGIWDADICECMELSLEGNPGIS